MAKIYGVQIHQTCATLVYNKDLLSAAGYDAPPTTWDEFRESLPSKTAKPGVFWILHQTRPLLTFFHSYIKTEEIGLMQTVKKWFFASPENC